MPLAHGNSRSVISRNISEMVHAGHPQRQAVAAALRTADKYAKRAAGGSAPPPTVPTYATAAPNVNSSGYVPISQPASNPYQLDTATGALTPGAQQALQQFAMRGLPGGPNGIPAPPVAAAAPTGLGGPTIPTSGPGSPQFDALNTSGGGGGMRRGGKLAPGGDPMVGYEQRHAMHTGMNVRPGAQHPSGLVHTAGPGRTDNVPMTVAPGSHVIPSDVVAGLGQGNTLAGAHALGVAMQGGPGGIKLPSGPHKSSIPAPPRPARFANGGPVYEGHAIKVARGGATNGVKCIVAGGEWVISPHEVEAITHKGKTRHHAVDAWILERRAADVKKLKSLPPPVKS